MDVRIRGRSREHAIEIVWELGYFYQSLPAAGRAAVPIGVLRACAVVGLDESLGFDHGFMHRARREIDNLLRVPQSEHTVAAFMAGVSGGSRITFAQPRRHLRKADDAGPASITHHLELPVPVLDWQPQFHLDVGVRR